MLRRLDLDLGGRTLKHDNDGNLSARRDMLVIKWMMGFVLAFQVAIFAKLFMH